MTTDIVIIGAGCAGLTAAVYAARAGRRVLILEQEGIGGQIATSPRVENYPGIPDVSGAAFSDALFEQAMGLGAEIDFMKVLSVTPDSNGFTLLTDGEPVTAKSVILATGARHRHLGVDREDDLAGNGVSYCAICDGAFFHGQDVAVVGGGSAALQSAEFLANGCRSVTLIHRRDAFRGEEALAKRVAAIDNVRLCLGATVASLNGDDALTGLSLNTPDGPQDIAVQGLFVCIGQQPNNGAFADLVELDEAGYIKAAEDCVTSCAGVFAAGDCRTKNIRQLTTAAADGTVAALAACGYIAERS